MGGRRRQTTLRSPTPFKDSGTFLEATPPPSPAPAERHQLFTIAAAEGSARGVRY